MQTQKILDSQNGQTVDKKFEVCLQKLPKRIGNSRKSHLRIDQSRQHHDQINPDIEQHKKLNEPHQHHHHFCPKNDRQTLWRNKKLLPRIVSVLNLGYQAGSQRDAQRQQKHSHILPALVKSLLPNNICGVGKDGFAFLQQPRRQHNNRYEKTANQRKPIYGTPPSFQPLTLDTVEEV